MVILKPRLYLIVIGQALAHALLQIHSYSCPDWKTWKRQDTGNFHTEMEELNAAVGNHNWAINPPNSKASLLCLHRVKPSSSPCLSKET